MPRVQITIVSTPEQQPSERHMAIGRNYEFTNPMTFGREPDLAQFVIKDGWISSRHFLIDFTGDTPYLTDLESKHGTFLNGNKVANRVLLKSEDTIKAGKTLFRFRVLSGATAKPSFDSADSPAIISSDFDSVNTLTPQDRSDLPDRPTDPDLEEAAQPAIVPPTRKQTSVPRKTSSPPSSAVTASQKPKNVSPLSPSATRGNTSRNMGSDQPVDSSGNEFMAPDSIPWTPSENNAFSDMPLIISDSSEGDIIEVDLDNAFARNENNSPFTTPPAALHALDNSSSVEASIPAPLMSENREHEIQERHDEQQHQNEYANRDEEESLTSISLESLTDVASEKLQSTLWQATSSSLPHGTDLAGFLTCIHKLLPLRSIVHFQRIGMSTPLSIAEAVPLIDWLPEPIARAYGPIECDLQSLLQSTSTDELRRLWLVNAVCFFGGKKPDQISSKLRSLCCTAKQGNNRSSELATWNLATVRMILENLPTEQIEKHLPADVFECVIMPALFDPKGWTLYSPYPFDSLVNRDL